MVRGLNIYKSFVNILIPTTGTVETLPFCKRSFAVSTHVLRWQPPLVSPCIGCSVILITGVSSTKVQSKKL